MAVSWSSKKCDTGAWGRLSTYTPTQRSTSRSQVSHSGCCAVDGSAGKQSGVAAVHRMMRSASRKLRESAASSVSSRNSF